MRALPARRASPPASPGSTPTAGSRCPPPKASPGRSPARDARGGVAVRGRGVAGAGDAPRVGAAVAAPELADVVVPDEAADDRVLRIVQPVHGVEQVLGLLRAHQVDLARRLAEAARAVAQH